MLIRTCALFLLIAALAFPAGGYAAGFLSVYEDLPLQAALTEVPGSALSFDSQDGRIVEVEAKGAVGKQVVQQFYATALPQLGWMADAPGQYHREQEILRIETSESGKGLLTVRFKVSPK